MVSGRLNSWVVSHSALIIGALCHALGHEFELWWQQTLFWTQAQYLHFLHYSIWFIWFNTIIFPSNMSCDLWNKRLKTNEIFLTSNRCQIKFFPKPLLWWSEALQRHLPDLDPLRQKKFFCVGRQNIEQNV